MALDLPVPRRVLVHGHWTMNQKKMSKSTGNVVNPFFAIDRFGTDTMRFFLAYKGSLSADSDYDNEFILRDYQKRLLGGIGNLFSRLVGCAKRGGWRLPALIADAKEGRLPTPGAEDGILQEQLERAPAQVANHMDHLDSRAALQHIMDLLHEVRKLDLPARPVPDEY